MTLGSPKHKAQFLREIIKLYHENIWRDEINLLELDELLGRNRTQKADIELKLERKEFKSASEGKKMLEKVQADIENAQAGKEAIEQKLVRWANQIELINRHSESA
jgi:hypothetical protein